ncbi:unnamed protein product [Allacma fusca]|uniref:Uncharacterized protein n=1 Tax=Allacma fusca TaxID=39272 RepID=A0A8J2NMD9_9HEXA|nr:unnamed protein product [Allacma fusca]
MNLLGFTFSFAFCIAATLGLKQYEDLRSKFPENEVINWVPSKTLKASFPYYLSGVSEEGEPSKFLLFVRK